MKNKNQSSSLFSTIQTVLWTGLVLITVTACGSALRPTLSNTGSVIGENKELEVPTHGTPLPSADYQVEVAPIWESVDAGSRDWTLYSFGVVDTLGPALVAGSSDMDLFCPNYGHLTRNEKLNFWVYLASAVAKFESNENPADRFLESTMGKDPVTGQPVWSEGLLQLSYQDELAYKFCVFNWAADSKLSPTDPNKTILQPKTNLLCGLQILNQQIERVGKIGTITDVYWSTLKPGGKYTAIPKIEKLTNAIPFCQPRTQSM